MIGKTISYIKLLLGKTITQTIRPVTIMESIRHGSYRDHSNLRSFSSRVSGNAESQLINNLLYIHVKNQCCILYPVLKSDLPPKRI